MAENQSINMELSIDGVVYAIGNSNSVGKREGLIFPDSILATRVDFLNIARRYGTVLGLDLEKYRGNYIQVFEFREDLGSGILVIQDVYFYDEKINRSVSIWEPNSWGRKE